MTEVRNDGLGKYAQEVGEKVCQVISWLLVWLQHRARLEQIWNEWLKTHMKIKNRRNYSGIICG